MTTLPTKQQNLSHQILVKMLLEFELAYNLSPELTIAQIENLRNGFNQIIPTV